MTKVEVQEEDCKYAIMIRESRNCIQAASNLADLLATGDTTILHMGGAGALLDAIGK